MMGYNDGNLPSESILIEEYSLMTLESTQTALPTKEIYLK
jgi:hypothetical protein